MPPKNKKPIVSPKEHHKLILNVVRKKFEDHQASSHILSFYTKQTDTLLCQLWPKNIQASLYAIAGYGRKALFPAADLDILIITNPDINKDQKNQIKIFLQKLWDYQFKVSQRVLTTSELKEDLITDQTFYTSLLDARLLIGNKYNLITSEIRKNWGDNFFLIKINERNKRLEKHYHTLEPDIKHTKGGLRDIHLLRWLAQHFYHGKKISYLVDKHIITPEEFGKIKSARGTLNQARLGLHLLTPPSDRLLFENQLKLAKIIIPIKDNSKQSRNFQVEALMKQIYQAISDIKWVTQTVLTHHASMYDKNFKHDYYLEAKSLTQSKLLKLSPDETWILIFKQIAILCQTNNALQFDIPTIRNIRAILPKLKSFREVSTEVKRQFVHLMQEKNLLKAFETLIHCGLLDIYLPEFADLKGQMQFDRYHKYPTDQHIFNILKEISSIFDKNYDKSIKIPLAIDIGKKIKRNDLLFLAGLFHDLGKGRNVDHSIWGADAIEEFAKAHDYPPEDISLMKFLVQDHLILSSTAQKQDIYNIQTIKNFSSIVGSVRYLNFLYLLTVCDIRATNPALWNNWTNSLLETLYTETKCYLEQDKSGYVQDLMIQNKKEKLIEITPKDKLAKFKKIWKDFPKHLFLHLPFESISWLNNELLDQDLIKVKDTAVFARQVAANPSDGEIYIISTRKKGSFYCITKTLMNLNLSILNARYYLTNKQNQAIDYYQVKAHPNTNWYYIEKEITQDLKNLSEENILDKIGPDKSSNKDLDKKLDKNLDKKLKPKTSYLKTKNIFNIKTQIWLSQLIEYEYDAKNNVKKIKPGLLQLEITTFDRPGLLASIASILYKFMLRLHEARIITHGARVRDVFLIDDSYLNYSLLCNLINKIEGI